MYYYYYVFFIYTTKKIVLIDLTVLCIAMCIKCILEYEP